MRRWILRDFNAAFWLSQVAFMDETIRMRRLRWQRNAAGTLAILLLLVGFGLAFPRSLARYRALRAAQAELVDLQAQIGRVQGEIVSEQKQIIELQQQIVALQKK